MSKISENHTSSSARMSAVPPPYEIILAHARAIIDLLIPFSKASPDLATVVVGEVVRGVYGAGAALDLPLPVIHFMPEAE